MKIQMNSMRYPNYSFTKEKQVFSQNQGNDSTLRSAKEGSTHNPAKNFLNIFTMIFDFFMGFLNPFCCYKKREGKINWKETFFIVSRMYKQVFPSKKPDFKVNREKLFKKEFYELSPSGKIRFKEHILICLALGQKSFMTDKEQKEFIRKNRTKTRFNEDYFSDIENPILQEAMKNFYAEAKEKSK